MASTENKEELQAINLSTLNVIQLSQLKSQLDSELNVFQDSLHSLKIAQTKFQESKDCLEQIKPDSEGKEIMVPLTGSMYVPGKMADPNKVMIDIGTGYYVEKDLDGAKDYFKRKVAFVTEQMEKIQAIGIEKSRVREMIMGALEEKTSQMQALKSNAPQKA